MNLKFVFGKYNVTTKEEWDLENSKVKDIIECIKDNLYYSNPIEFACSERSFSVNEILENDVKCVGCVRITPSFRTEILIDIILHPSIKQLSEDKIEEYYINIHNKLENLLRDMGVSEMKNWVPDNDDSLQNIYHELGYKYLDTSIDRFGEVVNLFSKILK